MKILVIGGTGKTGRKVVEKLKNKGIETHIGSRSASIPFDWGDPSNWEEVLEGKDAVYITYHPDLAVPGALESIEVLIKKIQRSSIKKVVLLSGKGEKEAELCEQVVINSGLNYIILRCSWFNQNFSESFFLDPILAGHVALPKAKTKVPYVDTDDISDVAVKVLLNESYQNDLFQLTGPEAISFEEIIKIISEVTTRNIEFTEITTNGYNDLMKSQGVPEDFQWLINYLFTNVLDSPGNNEVSPDVEKILNRKAKSFEQYAIETAKTGVWTP